MNREVLGTILYIGAVWGHTSLNGDVSRQRERFEAHIFTVHGNARGIFLYVIHFGAQCSVWNVLGHISFYWYTFGAQFFILIGFEASFFGCGRFRPIVRYEVHFFV